MKNEAHSTSPEGIPYPEYLLRVLFAAFYPAVKMAVDFNYPLDTVKDMMTLALWREAKRKHSTINLISLIFGKSTRTVKALSARFNKGGFFEESETNLMRRIEDLLRQGPMTFADLADRLPHSNEFDSTGLALRSLVRDGRVETMIFGGKQCYRVIPRHHDLYSDAGWEARVDALYEHLEAVTETIRRRFLDDDPECAAARTFTFRMRPEDMSTLREDLFTFIRSRYADLEAAAEGAEDARTYALYTGMAPKEGVDG